MSASRQLLAEMDGFDSNQGVIIMAATNRPEILDAALMRPERFDRQVLVDRPNVKGREKILRLHAKKIKLSPSVDLAVVAAKTPGLSTRRLCWPRAKERMPSRIAILTRQSSGDRGSAEEKPRDESAREKNRCLS